MPGHAYEGTRPQVNDREQIDLTLAVDRWLERIDHDILEASGHYCRVVAGSSARRIVERSSALVVSKGHGGSGRGRPIFFVEVARLICPARKKAP